MRCGCAIGSLTCCIVSLLFTDALRKLFLNIFPLFISRSLHRSYIFLDGNVIPQLSINAYECILQMEISIITGITVGLHTDDAFRKQSLVAQETDDFLFSLLQRHHLTIA